MAIQIAEVPPIPPVKTGRFDLSKFGRSVSLAVRSLWLHKLRAFLSVLGIIIGTGSVIVLMAFGEGSMQDALDDIKRQGATNLIVRSVKPSDDSATSSRSFVAIYGLKYRDLERFATFGDAIVRMVPMREFPSEMRYLERMHNGQLVATTPEYTDVNQLTLTRGRFLTNEDEINMSNTVVLGSGTADKLFPFEDPIGNTVQIRGHRFIVVGVIAERMPTGGTGGSQAAKDYNGDAYIPLSTCRARIGETVVTRAVGSRGGERVELSQVTMTVSDIDKVRSMGDAIKQMLEEEHPRRDWAVTIPLDKLEEAERTKTRFLILLVIIGGISLVVGGIGIMNIMLATVTERTREIGIRRALGAKKKDVVSQFLIEAVVQTLIGGILGTVCGMILIFIVPRAPGALAWMADKFDFYQTAMYLETVRLPAQLNIPSIFISVGASIIIGVVFGLYPAWRAAKLDPIEALRHT
jgi:putative ABC transport system permease protein